MESRTLLTVFVVDSTLDGPLATLRTNGTTELREAIADSVSTFDDPTSTIQFSPAIDGQTIKLTSFTNDLAAGSTIPGPSGLLVIGFKDLTIDGRTGLTKGITIARDATAAAFRLIYIDASSKVILNNITLKGGFAKGGDGGSFFNSTGGGAAGLGGAIYNDGILEIENSTLADNKAQGGLAPQGQDGAQGSGGGGLGADGGDLASKLPENGGDGGGPNGGAGGSIIADAGNGAFGGGGGGGEAPSALGVTLSAGPGGNGGFGGGGGSGTGRSAAFTGENGGNGGFGGGGGAAGGGKFFGTGGVGGFGGGSSVANTGGGGAGMGGAIFNKGGSVTIRNSTLTGNQAVGGTGGTGGQGLGGAVFNYNGLIAVTHSTLSLNTAAQGGRGIYNRDDSASVAATARINNTIIAQADTAVEDFTATGNGLTTGTGNLIGKASGFTGAFITGDPQLGALQDNGGLTPTMRPAAGSPAINAADTSLFRYSIDQRGFSRDFSTDIGAVELRKLQTITFAALADRTFGDADFAISATSSSGLPISFTATGNATVAQVGGIWYVHITGAGTATITAIQGGNAEYEPATSVSQTFAIAKAASVTTTVGAGPFTYNGTAQIGGSGTVTGAGGLNTSATSLTYSANADGTGVADFTNAGTYYVTARYAGDANHDASVGAAVAIVINKADANVTVTGYTGTYDGAAHGATGTATGVGGASVGTLNLGASFTNVPGGTAQWTFAGGRNYLDERGAVSIVILAKHITATFTAANKVYDGNASATVTSRSLVGVIGADAVSLTGGTATFASKNVGTWTVSLNGATLGGAAAGNYILDSVATTTAKITPRPLTGSAETQASLNVASNGNLSFRIIVNRTDIVDGQSVAQLFDGASFAITVGGRTYSVLAVAKAAGNQVSIDFRMSDELKSILAANTTATNGGKAPTVGLTLTAMSRDGNYSLCTTATTKLFNTSR